MLDKETLKIIRERMIELQEIRLKVGLTKPELEEILKEMEYLIKLLESALIPKPD